LDLTLQSSWWIASDFIEIERTGKKDRPIINELGTLYGRPGQQHDGMRETLERRSLSKIHGNTRERGEEGELLRD
jgi:hypothetical protein